MKVKTKRKGKIKRMEEEKRQQRAFTSSALPQHTKRYVTESPTVPSNIKNQ
jgi:hypothetical protein